MEQRQGPNPADAMVGLPFAMLQAYVGFYEVRSRAVADYWRALSAARRPEEVMGVQMDYWTTLLRDYAAVAAEGTSVPGLAVPQPVRSAPQQPHAA